MRASSSEGGSAQPRTGLTVASCMADNAARTELRHELRVIGSLGPSPMPPWVVCRGLPRRLKAELLAVLLGMQEDAAGRDILTRGRVARFDAVNAQWYEPIREVALGASRYRLRPTHVAAATRAGLRIAASMTTRLCSERRR